MAVLAALPVALVWFLVIGGSVALAVVGLYVVRRSVPLAYLELHNEIAGFIFATLGVTYSVILALVLLGIWEQYRDAATKVEIEVGKLGTIMLDAEALPDEVGREIGRQAKAYIRAVIEDEWPQMGVSGEESRRAHERLIALWRSVRNFEPRTAREVALYTEMLRRMNDMAEARAERILVSGSSLPDVLWAALLFGGLITVGYTFLYGTKNFAPHAVMVSALAAVIASVLFLIAVMDLPFTGDVSIKPDAFERLLSEPLLTEPR